MGYYRHDAVVIFGNDFTNINGSAPRWHEAIDAVCARMPENIRQLVLGPVKTTFGDVCFVMIPDGSKEGWAASDEADVWRERLLEAVRSNRESDGSGVDYVHVSFGGGDASEARVLERNRR